MNPYTFRFDDISVNTDPEKLEKMIAFLRSTFRPKVLRIILCVSPAVFDMRLFERTLDRERAFPPMFHTRSDFRTFYKVERVGIPPFIEKYRTEGGIEFASHGMIHVDHRLLSRSVQEMSIVMASALVKSPVFVPPFHKWNSKTEDICTEHAIMLVKFDISWTHLGYHNFDERLENFYFHTHDFHYQDFCAKFRTMAVR